MFTASVLSLAEELGAALSRQPPSLMMLKCHGYLRDEDSSPDVDSGHSTAHSPKSVSPQPTSPSPSSTGLPFTLEPLEPTHRGLHKFIPRHRDELDIEIGDPIYVQKEADDLWCEGKSCGSFWRSGSVGWILLPKFYQSVEASKANSS